VIYFLIFALSRLRGKNNFWAIKTPITAGGASAHDKVSQTVLTPRM